MGKQIDYDRLKPVLRYHSIGPRDGVGRMATVYGNFPFIKESNNRRAGTLRFEKINVLRALRRSLVLM